MLFDLDLGSDSDSDPGSRKEEGGEGGELRSVAEEETRERLAVSGREGSSVGVLEGENAVVGDDDDGDVNVGEPDRGSPAPSSFSSRMSSSNSNALWYDDEEEADVEDEDEELE